MAGEVEFKSNLKNVLSQYEGNKKTALTALGLAVVGFTVDQLDHGYGKPIYVTGDLMRSITSEIGNDEVVIGSNLNYAPIVHNGGLNSMGRPYLRDGIIKNVGELEEITVSYLNNNMD